MATASVLLQCLERPLVAKDNPNSHAQANGVMQHFPFQVLLGIIRPLMTHQLINKSCKTENTKVFRACNFHDKKVHFPGCYGDTIKETSCTRCVYLD